MTNLHVYKAINKITEALSKVGIEKGRTNSQGAGYKFRGIDDIYNAIAPLLAVNGLTILPRVISRDSVDRVTKSGGALFYVTVCVEFDFVSSEDGSKHTVITYGEAMDSSDKATNKAMSAAYKYACLQAFCIPTEGENDADAITHEVAARDFVAPAFIEAIIRELGEAATLDDLKNIYQSNQATIANVKKQDAREFKRIENAKDNRKATLSSAKSGGLD